MIYANGKDTTRGKDTILVLSYKEHQFLQPSEYTTRDSSLNNLQRYFLKNSLGNPGSAVTPLFLSNQYKTGFKYWHDPFNLYQFRKETVNYYHTRTPYTNVYLASGSKEEQYFKGLHTQNINSRLNFAAGFQRLRSGGDYLRQTTTHTGAFLNSNYTSKRKRYLLLANLTYNNLKADENGGIKSELEFEEAGFGDKKVIGVNLQSAQRRIWNKGAYIKQFVGYGTAARDTTSKDSTSKPAGYFSHSFFIEDNSILYKDDDPDQGYYANIFRDSVQTRDSVYFYKVENEIAWSLNNRKSPELKPFLEIGVRHQFVRVKQNEIDSAINNVLGRIGFAEKWKSMYISVAGNYVLSGGDQGDLDTKGEIRKSFKDTGTVIALSASFGNNTSSFLHNRYSSNHFEWEYHWEKSQTASVGLNYESKRYHLSAGISAIQYTDPLYFDTYARPKQYTGTINTFAACLKKDFHLGKWVIANHITYQYIPDSSIIRLPALIADHSIFYENRLFNRALLLQTGIDVFYTTAFMGNAYMPATSQFYLQNERQIGNYPYVDVFLNFRIRTVKAFLKYEHANAGFLGNVFYMAPLHPMADGSFVFGLSWDFYN
jgi:hypothetical protein